MNFAEQPPSTKWSALMFKGQRIAEVWFKPEGDPLTLLFRIPQSSFQIPGLGERLTAESLLKGVGIAASEVESWNDVSDADLTASLSPPPDDANHLEIRVRLKPPADTESPVDWHELEVRWKAILGQEATLDLLRKNVESLRAEMEASMRGSLSADEKVNALAADVAQWNKAKSRVHFTLPKASEFIHRVTWSGGTPERKRLGELFKDPIENQISLPPVQEVMQELEVLRKDRQVLTAQGTAVSQECRAIIAEVQGALRRLQTNAAIRASKKKGGTGAKGKSL